MRDQPRAEHGVCALCGRELEEGARCYAMPDGLVICDEGACLRDWAAPYWRWAERGAEG